MDRDDDGTGSHRSGVTGSETSSQREDTKFLLKKRGGAAGASEEEDLLEQKRTIEDGIFSCMYTLVRTSALSSWKFAILKVALEFLMFFIVSFNPEYTRWSIDVSSPVWQVVRWSLWRSPITRLYGYKTYIIVMYVMAAMVYLAVGGLVFLTHSMRRAEQSKGLRMAALYLHGAYDIIFFTSYASFFDYFIFAANCNFAGKVKSHMYFDNIMCFEMPHLLHFCVAVLTAAVFLAVTICLVVASGDLNPVSLAALASPAVLPRLKILAAKAVFIVCADVLDSVERVQAVLNVLCVGLICWWNLRTAPFYRRTINAIWFGLWLGILYTTALYGVVVFRNEHDFIFMRRYTKYVLHGIFPVIAGGAVLCVIYNWMIMRPAQRFRGVERDGRLSKLYKFSDSSEVERLSRCMRVLDADGVVDEAAAYWGENVLKAGMQAFPNDPYLLILYANFLLEVRKDGPAARTQLQLASKHTPSVIQRYQVFCTLESSKRLKDIQEGGMDLQAYIEFKRNYRAVLRVHKEALGLQVDLWKLYLKPQVRVAEVDAAMDELERVTVRAQQVYRRVLERYPTNGKLLRCYGKFLEDIRHDLTAAARVYADANRSGGAGASLELDLTSLQTGTMERPEVFSSISMEDAIVVVNAAGTIMMVSQAVQTMFGYASLELEGANVSLLMPPPFTQRHAGYMSRYAATGEARILDTVREVVGLHKDRYVFPLSICVTKLSGTGSDSVFLGLLRPVPASLYSIRVWIAPNGILLCGDQTFASMVGLMEGEMVGKSLSNLVTPGSQEALEALLEKFRTASASELTAGNVRTELQLLHRYIGPVSVEVTVGMAGTDTQRILVLNFRRTDGLDGNIMVVDVHMRLKFVSLGVAAQLGFSIRQLTSMRLDQLLPSPFNALHAKWIKDPPHIIPSTSCRAGLVVPLLNEYGSRIPVRIKLLSGNSTDVNLLTSTHHIVQVEKVSAGEDAEERCLVLTVDFHGRVRGVMRPDGSVFGFHSWMLMGASLCDFVDVFGEWRQLSGNGEMQMLLLALLDKEQEIPGASWRVRVREPPRAEELEALVSSESQHLPSVTLNRRSSTTRRGGERAVQPLWRSACLQVELIEDHDVAEGSPRVGGDVDDDGDGSQARVKVVLWRRDLLSGVVEMDEDLTVFRANAATGLIFGLPPSFMRKKLLGKFLDIPHGSTWTSLTAAHNHHHHHRNNKSSLKASSDRGHVSPPFALTGSHPDGGTMRVVLQGVQTLGPGGRPKVCVLMHADTTFVGARADIMRVLHLRVAHSFAVAIDPAASGRAGGAVPRDTSGTGGGPTTGPASTVRQLGGAKSVQIRAGEEAGSLAAGPLQPISEEEGVTGAGDGEEGGGGDGNMSFSDGVSRGIHRHSTAVSSDDLLAGDDVDGGGDGDGDGDMGEDGEDGSDGAAVNDAADQDAAAHEVARLHRQATSRSEFVSQWVRTVMANRVGNPGGFGLGPAASETGGLGPSLSLDRRPGSVGIAADQTARSSHPQRLHSLSAFGSTLRRTFFKPRPSRSSSNLEPTASGGENVGGSSGRRGPAAVPPCADVGASGRQMSRRSAASLSTVGSMRTGTEGSDEGGDGSGGGGAKASGGNVGASGRNGAKELLEGAGGGGGGGGGTDSDGGNAAGRGEGGEHDGTAGGKWEKASDAGDSSIDDSESASGFTSMTDQSSATDLAIDTRRQRLHKALDKVLLGPALAIPVARLQYTSYIIMVFMLMAHIVCYIVVTKLVKEEHNHVYRVYEAAQATDKAQLIMWRIMMGPYCERKNITDKSSACGNTMSYTLSKLSENIAIFETYHQEVYLGVKGLQKLEPRVYDLWTAQNLQYSVYLDTSPAMVVEASAGIWQLGNRFLAAARESLYWMPKLKDKYMLHRHWKFIVSTGMGPLFNGSTLSLDYLMTSAWDSVEHLKIDLIILLVVEALCIQLLCSAFQWYLVTKVERARVVGLMALVGLPAPVLRQLASQELKVWDDDEDDDSDEGGSEDLERTGRNNGGAEGGNDHDHDHHHHHHHHHHEQQGQEGDGEGGKKGEVGVFLAAEVGGNGKSAESDGGGDGGDGDDELAAVAAAAARAAGRQKQKQNPKLLQHPVNSREGLGLAAGVPLTHALPQQSGGVAGGEGAADPGSPAVRRQLLTSRTGKFPKEAKGKDALLGPQREEDSATHKRVSAGGSRSERRLSTGGGGGGGDGGGAAARRHLARAGMVFGGRGTLINGRVLVPSYSNLLRLVAPFVLLNAAVIVVFTVSLALLSGMQGPLAALNMAAHVVYRYTHMRCCAWGLVAADDVESKSMWRELLKGQIRLFEDEYNVLMYGGLAVSQMNGAFQEQVPASTFSSVEFAQEFFRTKRCFRWDQSLCLPRGHKYFEATHNGLDVMVRRVIQEMTLLSLDDDAEARYNKSRYDFIHLVGGRDCYEGLQSGAQMFVDYSIRRYNEVTQLHTILLASTCGIFLMYTLLLLWPRLARIRSDAARQSALLSHVPPEVDVKGHVRMTFRKWAGGAKRKGVYRGGS